MGFLTMNAPAEAAAAAILTQILRRIISSALSTAQDVATPDRSVDVVASFHHALNSLQLLSSALIRSMTRRPPFINRCPKDKGYKSKLCE